jgi:hypothetical protein
MFEATRAEVSGANFVLVGTSPVRAGRDCQRLGDRRRLGEQPQAFDHDRDRGPVAIGVGL